MAQHLEPIPLRTLITLLSYEVMVSDPRYYGMALVETSVVDDTMVSAFRAKYAEELKSKPKSIKNIQMHLFKEYKAAPKPCPVITCDIHPQANLKVRELTVFQREQIFLESRHHDGCFKAVGLIEFFFKQCPPGQKISIQLTNEELLIVDPSHRFCELFKIQGPKQLILTAMPSQGTTYHTGNLEEEDHVVIIFNPPEAQEPIAVDITRTQYGTAGRGELGEPYFLGTRKEWVKSMEQICENAKFIKTAHTDFELTGSDNEKRLMACAAKAWQRWNDREKENRCEYCGNPGDDKVNLGKCGGCTAKEVWYCCVEHQKFDYERHKLNCEKPV